MKQRHDGHDKDVLVTFKLVSDSTSIQVGLSVTITTRQSSKNQLRPSRNQSWSELASVCCCIIELHRLHLFNPA